LPFNNAVPLVPATVRLKLFVTDAGGVSLSVTVMLNVFVACAVGVPERTPAALSVRPEGRLDPLATDHWYGVVPPLAVNCKLYAAPWVPPCRGDAVVIARLLTLIVRD
jgi:hypothetical protein